MIRRQGLANDWRMHMLTIEHLNISRPLIVKTRYMPRRQW